MLGLGVARRGNADDFDLRSIRSEILQALVACTLLVLVFWIIWIPDLRYSLTFVPPIASLLIVGLAHLLRNPFPPLAASTYLVGLVAFAGGLSVVTPDSPAIYFLGPLVVLAGILLGSGPDLILAAILTIGVLAIRLPFQPGDAGNPVWPTLAMIWFCALLSFVASRPLYLALGWSWHSYLQASEKMEEARTRQGELARLSKSLNESYLRLEEVSRELEQARKIAEEARRLKSQFAVSISHEMRTPLNLIIGFSEMMVMAPHAYGEEALPPTYRGDVGAIYRNARHLSNLIDDVLDLSQIEAGRMGLHKEWISLLDAVHEAEATVLPLYERKRLSLVVDLPDNLPLIYADRTRVRQIFINLLSNATRFTDEGGVTVSGTLELQDGDQQVHLIVADTGIGIDERELGHLFEEFRQFGEPSQRHDEGTGLGLAISRRFTQLHGGKIWAESAPGGGTRFHLSLPVVGQLALIEHPTAARVPTLPRADEAVAVIGDRTDAIHLFQRYLDGYQVVPASDASGLRLRAVVQVASSLDEGVEKLRIRPLGPPHVLQATCVLTDHLDVYQQLGASHYLAKPVSRETLLHTLDTLGPRVRRLLIVDDDHGMVELLSRMIQSTRRRYQIRKAYSGREALDLLRRSRPDAVLLDLAMPDLDGYSVLAWMKNEETTSKIPVIVVTGQGTGGKPVTANLLMVTTPHGLSMGQLMACLKASLQAIESAPSTDTDPAPRAVPTE